MRLMGVLTALALLVGVAAARSSERTSATRTPIKYLVVIFDENNSFDHYFGRYPSAENTPGEPAFHARRGTPRVNGLTHALLTENPNETQPFRLPRSKAFTCNPKGGYRQAQEQFHHGLMDRFTTKNAECPTKGEPMAYVDGNTVTALWNYAQHFAMSDNSFQTSFGKSLQGHINLISGQTHGATPANISPNVVRGTLIGDVDPAHDGCSREHKVSLSGKNVGNLLNRAGVTWGWFEGGFTPTDHMNGKPVCGRSHKNIAGQVVKDYVMHHEPFQYYRSTANPQHLPPRSAATVGRKDRANHQYDLHWFWRAAKAGNQPQVSFLKARHFEDGHPGVSDPIDEQRFLVNTINALQRLPTWRSTAIVIA